MKTIFVIYTNSKIIEKKNLRQIKQYAFNTASEVSVNDMLDANGYNTQLQVVAVLDQAYKYYNKATGELSDKLTSTAQFEISTLKVLQEEANVVYAHRL